MYVGEGETVRVIMRFGPNIGRYMMHCHNLVHEDHDMMVQFEVGHGRARSDQGRAGPQPAGAAALGRTMSTGVQTMPRSAPRGARGLRGRGARGRAGAVALLSLGAAWVHLAYAAPHLRQWWAYGAFFVVTGAAQALFALLIVRRRQAWVLAAGVAGNAAIIAMYVVSRTYGPPLGPHARVPEVAGPVDLATTAAEVCLVGVLLTMMAPRARRHTANLLAAFAALVWALRLTGRLP